jgi:hypothetical protein
MSTPSIAMSRIGPRSSPAPQQHPRRRSSDLRRDSTASASGSESRVDGHRLFDEITALDVVKGSLACSAAAASSTPSALRAGLEQLCDGRRMQGKRSIHRPRLEKCDTGCRAPFRKDYGVWPKLQVKWGTGRRIIVGAMNSSQRAMWIFLLPHILILCVSSANCTKVRRAAVHAEAGRTDCVGCD